MNQTEKTRLLIITDIGGDPDDQQAMIRLMLYSNEFAIEGLIASSRMEHGHDVRPELIGEIVAAFGAVRDNLLLHDSDYPTALYLQSVIKSGQPIADCIGDGQNTDASAHIIACVDKDDSRPLNIAIWGGATDLAQALYTIKTARSPKEYAEFISKIRVYSIGKQDGGIDFILDAAPNIFMVLSLNQVSHLNSVYRGIYLGGDETLTSADFITENIKQNHGPLGSLYPTQTWTGSNPYNCMKEGDTPSWFYFLMNAKGLSDPENPSFGGWGGRFAHAKSNLWLDSTDTYDGVTDSRACVFRWRPAYQNDFAARMDWCVKPFTQANHNPIAIIGGDASKRIIKIFANPEEIVFLDASKSIDPDADTLSFRWWVYKEAGNDEDAIFIKGSNTAIAQLEIPKDAKGKEIHVILELKDNGIPSLTCYRRVVISAT